MIKDMAVAVAAAVSGGGAVAVVVLWLASQQKILITSKNNQCLGLMLLSTAPALAALSIFCLGLS